MRPMRFRITRSAMMGVATVALLHATLGAQPLRHWRSRFPQQSSSTVWDGVFTQEQAGRGQGLYHQNCASCHGEALTGGDEVPPLAGSQFLANWNGLTLGDLFERVRVSMPQNNPGHLSRQVNADILSYMLSVNGFPSGPMELSHETEVLKQILIESVRPDRPTSPGTETK